MQIEEVNGRAEPVTGFHWLCPFQLLFYFSGFAARLQKRLEKNYTTDKFVGYIYAN